LRLLGSLQAGTLALLWATDWRPPLLAGLFIVFHCEQRNNERMAEHVYKKIEIVGSSPNGMEEAVRNALSRASKTIRNMRWFEITETRGYIDEGKIEHWQVTLKIGFTLEE
jgi:dodecin